jgi:catechol 2,3-dioxygenase-like lactoylglutathione lyase family enzyme
VKRLHLHVGVENLARSIDFYSTLFGAPPTVTKSDYAKWMLDDPRVNFAISSGRHDGTGIEHVGIEAESGEELSEVYNRLREAGRPVLEEGETVCCYANSEKSWVSDPDGVIWEAFHTIGEATVYGESPPLDTLSGSGTDAACCTPETPQGVCCAPKPDLSAGAPCCGPA